MKIIFIGKNPANIVWAEEDILNRYNLTFDQDNNGIKMMLS